MMMHPHGTQALVDESTIFEKLVALTLTFVMVIAMGWIRFENGQQRHQSWKSSEYPIRQIPHAVTLDLTSKRVF